MNNKIYLLPIICAVLFIICQFAYLHYEATQITEWFYDPCRLTYPICNETITDQCIILITNRCDGEHYIDRDFDLYEYLTSQKRKNE